MASLGAAIHRGRLSIGQVLPFVANYRYLSFMSKTEDRMSLAAHLAELSEKHKHLERRIEQEQSRPASSDEEIRRLKLEKLRLKEQITKLQSNGKPH